MSKRRVKPMRNVKIDFIKTMAIIFVVSIHVLAGKLVEFKMGQEFLVVSFYRSLVSSAVPLFFMSSGVLLFHPQKEITIRDICYKYIPRILIALFFWASIYEVIQAYYRYRQVGILERANISLVLKNILFFQHNYHLYFLYIMLVFYLFTPMIKKIIDNSQVHFWAYILLVWLGLGILLPTFVGFKPVSYFSNLTQYILMPMGYASLGYGLLGHYIANHRQRPSHYLTIFCLGLLAAFFLTLLLCLHVNAVNITFWGGMSLTVAMMAYGLFGFVFATDFPIYHSKIVSRLSRASFAIYLLHDIFLKVLSYLNIGMDTFPILVSGPIIVFIVLLASYLSYLVLAKIKIVNRYLI